MKTRYFTATSLDGYIATEDDSIDWLFPLGDINDTAYSKFIAQVGALAMGAATYEWMLRHALRMQRWLPRHAASACRAGRTGATAELLDLGHINVKSIAGGLRAYVSHKEYE